MNNHIYIPGLTEADNSRPKGYFSGHLSDGIWAVCRFSKLEDTLRNQISTSILLYDHFLD